MIIIMLGYCLLNCKLHEGKDQGWFITVTSVPRTVPSTKWADKLFIEWISKQIFGPVYQYINYIFYSVVNNYGLSGFYRTLTF